MFLRSSDIPLQGAIDSVVGQTTTVDLICKQVLDACLSGHEYDFQSDVSFS